MTKLLPFLIATLVCILVPHKLLAAMGGSPSGFMLGVSAMKLDTSTSGPTLGNVDASTTIFDLKAGYTMGNGLYFGGIYDDRSEISNGSKNERTGMGATLGYHNAGWFIDGSYYVTSMYKMANGSELKEGSGFGVDVGNNVDVTANVYLGLQISYKSFSYKKLNAADEDNKVKSELTPMANLGLMF